MHQQNSIEQDWLAALSTKDENLSFEKIYLSYWDKLYQMAWARTKDEDVAKDLVQEVFVSFWNKRKDLKINTSLFHYLAGILKYKLLDYYQSEKTKQRVFEYVYQHMETFVEDVNDMVVYKELEKKMQQEIEKMPENMRKSFLMKLDNNSVKDIADELGLAEQTVYNSLSDAYRRLRDVLWTKPYKDNLLLLLGMLDVIYNLLTQS